MEHNNADFTTETVQHTRTRWHEKNASPNLERDSSKLWNLTKVLNEEAPSPSTTVLHVNNELLTEKKAANNFEKLYKTESSLRKSHKISNAR